MMCASSPMQKTLLSGASFTAAYVTRVFLACNIYTISDAYKHVSQAAFSERLFSGDIIKERTVIISTAHINMHFLQEMHFLDCVNAESAFTLLFL